MRSHATLFTINKPRRSITFLMGILAIILAFASPVSAAAQSLPGTSYVTTNGEYSITWTDDWVASLTQDDDFSTMIMLEGQIMIYSAMFLHDPDLGLSERAIYQSFSGVLTGSFESDPTTTVEWQNDEGAYLGVHLIPISGIDFVIFMRVTPGTENTGPIMQFAGAPVRAFPVSLDAMQEELSINGAPVFDGEDGEEVLAILEGETTISAAQEPQSTSDNVESEAAPAPASDSDASSDESSNPLLERSRIDRDPGSNRGASDPASSGGAYTSPENGYTVTWPENWVDMAESNTTIGEFSLTSDTGRSVVSFTGRSTTETNREAYFEDIVARESRYPGFVGSVIEDDRLILASWTSSNELAVLEYVFVDDDTVVTIMVTISSGSPDRYIEDIQGVELDGTPILRDWDELWADQ